MTLEDIKAIDREYLIPSEVAPILGADPQDIRESAKQCPERLGFPVSVIKTRVKIPKAGFVKFMTGEG